MKGLEKTRENRAFQAVSILRELDTALDDDDLELDEVLGYITLLSQNLGNDTVTTGQFYSQEIIPKTKAIGYVRQNMAAIGLRMPLRFPSEESFKTVNAHPGYVPAAIDLVSRMAEGHEECRIGVRDVLFSPVKVPLGEHRHCVKLEVVRFILGTDMSFAQRDLYARVYAQEYETFRRGATDELYANDIIDATVHSMAHIALTGTMAQSRMSGPRHFREES